MKTKKFLKIALLVVIAALFIWTFVFLYQKSQPKVTVYETIVPEVTDLEKTTVATGKVEPRDEVLIKPQISGIIAEVYKEAGQSVKQGEVLAKVKVIPELGQLNSAESRVRLAEINAAQAETDFARTQKLYNDKLISAEEYEKGSMDFCRLLKLLFWNWLLYLVLILSMSKNKEPIVMPWTPPAFL